jgi:hypothetical protein
MTVGAFGVLISIFANMVFGPNIQNPEMRFLVALGGGVILYCLLIPVQIMTISSQQTICRIAKYIRIYIEGEDNGLQYETLWNRYKENNNLAKGLRGTGGIYVFFSFMPLLLPLLTFINKFENWILMGILLIFLTWSSYLAYDMYNAKSRGWNYEWPDEGIKK